jgi:hypothetical protein
MRPLNWMITIAICAISFTTGYLIYREDLRALQMVKAYFIVELIFAQVFFLIAWRNHIIQGTDFFAPHAEAVSALKFILYVIVWWLYFHYSVRVRNTFGSNL